MTLATVLADVNAVIKEVLEDDNVTVREESTANDVDGWDSLTNIELMVAIEKHFRIRFTAAEIQGFKNVGEMSRTILAKLQQR